MGEAVLESSDLVTSRRFGDASLRVRRLAHQVFSGPNLVLVCAFIGYETAALFVTTLPGFPAPSLPIAVTGDWASWFDIDFAFPALIVVAYIILRPTGIRSAIVLVTLTSMLPTYYVAASYVFAYDIGTFNGLAGGLLALILVSPTLIALLPIVSAASGGDIELRPRLNYLLHGRRIWAAFLIPSTLVLLQIGLSLTDGVPANPFLWTSDIGWTLQYGGGLVLHGISPYSHGLAPYGGYAPLYYGPLSFALVAPFGVFEVGIAAHLSAAVFAGIAALGVWASLRLVSPKRAVLGTAIFVLLPSTYLAVRSGTTLHILAAASIAWSIYFFLRGRSVTAGLMCAVGTLVMILPGALLLPFLASSKSSRGRLRLLIGFAPIMVLTILGGLLVLPADRVSSLFVSLVHTITNFSQFTYLSYLPGDLRPWFIWPMLIIATGASLALSYFARGDTRRILLSCLWLLMLLPVAIGYYLVFFFVWASIPLVLLMCSGPQPTERVARSGRTWSQRSAPLELTDGNQ